MPVKYEQLHICDLCKKEKSLIHGLLHCTRCEPGASAPCTSSSDTELTEEEFDRRFYEAIKHLTDEQKINYTIRLSSNASKKELLEEILKTQPPPHSPIPKGTAPKTATGAHHDKEQARILREKIRQALIRAGAKKVITETKTRTYCERVWKYQQFFLNYLCGLELPFHQLQSDSLLSQQWSERLHLNPLLDINSPMSFTGTNQQILDITIEDQLHIELIFTDADGLPITMLTLTRPPDAITDTNAYAQQGRPLYICLGSEMLTIVSNRIHTAITDMLSALNNHLQQEGGTIYLYTTPWPDTPPPPQKNNTQ